ERIARVTTFQKFILGALLVADAAGVAAGIGHAARSEPAPKVELVAQVLVRPGHARWSVPIVVSRNGRIMATASPRPTEMVALHVRPGRYQLSVLADRVCTTTTTVTAAPLQTLIIRCRQQATLVTRRRG